MWRKSWLSEYGALLKAHLASITFPPISTAATEELLRDLEELRRAAEALAGRRQDMIDELDLKLAVLRGTSEEPTEPPVGQDPS